MYKHVLVPTDGSSLSRVAVREGATLAAALGAEITLLTVTAPFTTGAAGTLYLGPREAEHVAAMEEVARAVLDEGRAIAEAAGVRACQTIHRSADQPWHEVIEVARQEGCDLIAMASHGRSGIAAVILGSETTKVLTHSRIPVLVYR